MSTVGFLILSQYFKKRRGRATAFLQCGVGIGRMLSPLVVQLLQTEYGYRGSTMIVGAICLQSLVGAALYHPVEWHMRRQDPVRKRSHSDSQNNDSQPQKLPLLSQDTHNLGDKTNKKEESTNINKKEESTNIDKKGDWNNLDKKRDSINNIQSKIDTENLSANSHNKNVTVINDKKDGSRFSASGATVTLSRRTKRVRNLSQCSYTSNMSLEHSDMDLVSLASVVSLATVIDEEMEEKDNEIPESSPPPKRKQQNVACRILHRTAQISRAVIKDVTFLRHPPALAMTLATALTMSSSNNLITILPFAVQADGYSLEVAAWCLFVSGITNFVVRLASSALSDFSWFNMRLVLLGGLFIMAAAITGKFPR